MGKPNKFTGGGVNQNKAAMMQRVQQMQAEMERIQNEVSEQTVTATAGGGAVTVVMKGSRELVSVNLTPEVVDPDDIEMLEDLIVAAINEAGAKANEMMEQGMSSITGGLNIPGLF
ncbi:MAG: YbaB/EbfC family nucleoid-associated protein [Ruminococcaceae bacterium]|nr:YbaB/EbfC family nucleoid-associated protein [Oscillospiraceae bacterium]